MNKSGFTLVEILLAVALMGLLAVLSVPVYQSLQVKNDLDITANTWVQTLRRAQVLAQAVDGDVSWGVKVQSEGLTLFKGASWATRDPNYDEIFDVPATITPSGLTEIVFIKFTGLPQTTGTTTLTAATNQNRTININAKGTPTY